MNIKQHVTALIRDMPEDVTLDEVIYWVSVLDMIGAGVASQKDLYEELLPDLRQDMADYFGKAQRKRKLRAAAKPRKKRSAGAA